MTMSFYKSRTNKLETTLRNKKGLRTSDEATFKTPAATFRSTAATSRTIAAVSKTTAAASKATTATSRTTVAASKPTAASKATIATSRTTTAASKPTAASKTTIATSRTTATVSKITAAASKASTATSRTTAAASKTTATSFVTPTKFKMDSPSHTTQQSVITASVTARPDLFNRGRVNLESHQLFWCDADVHSNTDPETTVTIEQLRNIVDYTKLYENASECEQYLEQTTDTTTFLVCSGSFGQTLIPRIHQLKNVRSIYIYCQNEEYHREWFAQYDKVKQVYNNLDSLLLNLTNDVKEYVQQEKQGLFSDSKRDDNSTELSYMSWWPDFIHFLCNLPYPSSCHQQLATELESYYADNESELCVVKEFASEYSSDKAVWWYTRPCFLYRLLNKALRQENIQLLFLFGFYIRDLYLQLKTEYEKNVAINANMPPITVFRGSIMSLMEIEYISYTKSLLYAAGDTRLVKSFCSTSLDQQTSLEFLQSVIPIPEGSALVLWEIELNLLCSSQPFAEISHLSAIPMEREVLFMIGTVLEVKNIAYSKEEKVYRMKLSLEHYPDMKDETDYKDMTLKRTLKKCACMVVRNVEHKSWTAVNSVFDGLGYLYPSEKGWLEALRYQYLGDTDDTLPADEYTKMYTKMIENCQRAVTLWQPYLDDSELMCTVDIANIHQSIAKIYRSHFNDEKRADEQDDLAMEACVSAVNSLKGGKYRAEVYRILAKIYSDMIDSNTTDDQKQELVDDVFYYKQQEIQEHLEHSTSDPGTIARCYEETGHFFDNTCNNVDEALIYYEKASEAYFQQKNCEAQASLYENIADIYRYRKNDNQTALKYYLLQHQAIEQLNNVQNLRANYEAVDKMWKVAWNHRLIGLTCIQLCDFPLAREHLMKGMELSKKMNDIKPHSGDNILSYIETDMSTPELQM